jgi:ribosomal-protein-alanine N-acetyltransferase
MTALATRRLRLRPFTLADHAAHASLYSDAEVMRYMPRGPLSPAAARQASHTVLRHFIEHWAQHAFGVWAVTDKATGVLLGQCGLRFLPELNEVEVLYLLARACWGQGLASEAARAALTYGFDEVGLERIIALTRPENTASRRVMEKLGMRYEKNLHIFHLEAVYYAVTRDVWRQRREAGQGSAGVQG